MNRKEMTDSLVNHIKKIKASTGSAGFEILISRSKVARIYFGGKATNISCKGLGYKNYTSCVAQLIKRIIGDFYLEDEIELQSLLQKYLDLDVKWYGHTNGIFIVLEKKATVTNE